MDANTEMAIGAIVLTAAVLAFGHSLKKLTRVSQKRLGAMERRLEDLGVYTRHLTEDVRSLHEGIRRKIDADAARLRMEDAAKELSMTDKEAVRVNA